MVVLYNVIVQIGFQIIPFESFFFFLSYTPNGKDLDFLKFLFSPAPSLLL